MTSSNAPDSGGPESKSRIWTHPITLLLITTLVSGAGWIVNRAVTQRDALRAQNENAARERLLALQSQSDLRFQVQDLAQGLPLIAPAAPTVDGQRVFCDTARMTLVIAHNGEGKQPIMVNDIGVKVEPVAAPAGSQKIDCAIDTLASKPFGIVERDRYILDVSPKGTSGRFIHSAKPGEAFPVNPQNILDTSAEQQAITLKPGEEQTGYAVYVVAAAPGLYRVWFTADYDAAGAKQAQTQSFLLAK
jgi:hypothetical protein